MPTKSPSSRALPRSPLVEICDVQLGHSPRAAVNPSVSTPWRILLGRHVHVERSIDWSELGPCEHVRELERFALHDGDVLLTTRSNAMRAVAVTAVPPNIVVSAQFAILRPRPEVVDARFLAWSLNQQSTRRRLAGLLQGSTIPFLAVGDIRSFEIPLPPLERQRAIVRAIELQQRAEQLQQRLARLFDRLIEAASRKSTHSRQRS